MKKVAIVTGGAQGIGRGISMFFYNKDIQVIAVDLDEEAGLELQSMLPGVYFIKADVGDEHEVFEAVNETIRQFGQLDYLINNAGISINKPIETLSLDEWNRVLSTNLTSVFLFAKHAASWLKKTKGSIVNIASTRAFMSEANTEAYSATKGGVVALTHALAISLGPEVRVNSVSPGWIEVSDYQKSANRQIPVHSEADRIQHPVGRVGRPDDIADFVYYLISRADSFITGQNFTIDGGMTKKMIYV
jgi:NAD(P)-dependent dehydrogenase (short-subunit alcohol dehydrogenase family)